MRNVIVVLAIGLFGTSSVVQASTVGNGGDIVVCRDVSGAVLSTELLDYYESRVLRGLNREMGPASSSYQEKIAYILAKRSDVAPFRARYWGGIAANFESNALFLPASQLVDIPDSNHIVLPRGCAVEQAVIQQEPVFSQDKRYIVNQDLWDILSEENKAGLVMHEAILSEAKLYGATNSVYTRYLNALWASSGVPKELSTTRDINKTFLAAQFAAGESLGCNPLLVSQSQVWNYPTEEERLAHLVFHLDRVWPLNLEDYFSDGFPLRVLPSLHTLSVDLPTRFGQWKFSCNAANTILDASISFNEARQVRLGCVQRGTYVSAGLLQSFVMDEGKCITFEDRSPDFINLSRGEVMLEIRDAGSLASFPLKVLGPWFFGNGQLSRIFAFGAFSLHDKAGNIWTNQDPSNYSNIYFDEDGWLTSCTNCVRQ